MRASRIVAIAGLLVAMLLVQLVLAGSPLSGVRPAAAYPPAVLTIGLLETVDSLNPYRGITSASSLFYGLLYDYPFSYDQDGNLVPNLITSATCDAACMNWTYTVRQGVYWSDDTPLTAADVNFTWNYDSQNLAYLWAFEPYFNQVVQCNASNRGRCGAVISPANPWQVTVYFQRPYVAGETLFAPILQEAQWSGISPSKAATTYNNPTPIGTGPFIADPNLFTEWQNLPASALHVYRNPRYHPVGLHVGTVNITDIYLRVYNDPSTLAQAVTNGTVQLAEMTTGGWHAVQGAPNILTQASLQATQRWNEVGFSQIDNGAADARLNPARWDANVRIAMAKATNKDHIVQNVYSGQGVRGDSLVSPIMPQFWYDPVAGGDNLTFDVAAANAILNESGYTTWSGGSFGHGYRSNPNAIDVSFQPACYQCLDPPNATKTIPAGTLLQFVLAIPPASTYPEYFDTATYLQAAYAQIGVEILIKVETGLQPLVADIYGGYVEMYIWYWTSDPDPNYILSMQSSWTLDGWNDNYWNNATYNHDYLREMGDLSPTQRQTDVRAAEKIQYESAVYDIYIYPYGLWAMRTDLWQGWGDWSAHPYRQMDADWGANPLWLSLYIPGCNGCANQPPSVPVIEGPSTVNTTVGVNVTFTATTLEPETTDTLNWTWSWGDGTSTTDMGTAADPVSTMGHVWTAEGNYTVSVNVTDGWNSPTQSANQVLVVVAPPVPGTLRGVVLGLGQAPVTGVTVIVTPGSRVDHTNGSGGYSFSLTQGTYSLSVTAAGYENASRTGVFVHSGSVTVVNFTLTPLPGWISGTVLGGGNVPLANATVAIAQASGQGSIVLFTVTTDSSGGYSKSVPAGTYLVAVSAPGYGPQNRSGVEVGPGASVRVNFTLELSVHPSAPLSLAVVGAVGAGIAAIAAVGVALFLLRRHKKSV